MVNDHTLIDRIVSGVLTQLRGTTPRAAREPVAEAPSRPQPVETRSESAARNVVELSAKVVTAEVIESVGRGVQRVVVGAKTIVTPAAWDVAKLRGVTVERLAKRAVGKAASSASPSGAEGATDHGPLVIIVHHTDAVGRVWEDLQSTWRRDFLGCPDDAAKLAISEVARGGVSQVVILANQTHRAACLANRHASVKAAAIRDVVEIPAVRQQIRANVWCLDPTGKSWFELKRLFATLDTGH